MDESYLSWLRLIPGITEEVARRIAERYPDPELLKGATPADLAAIEGITPETAARIADLVRTAAKADTTWYRQEPGLYLCPECGSFVGRGSAVCPVCGVAFEEGGEEAAPAPVEELLQSRNGEAKICTQCGAFLEPGATACGICGTEYGAEKLPELPAVDTSPVSEADLYLCPNCGAFLVEGASSCMICGKPVGQEERIPGLKGVSKDFLSRWQKIAEGPSPAAAPTPPSLEDELRHYERLLEADPTLERAWLRKGRILIELGRAAEAVECFDRAGRLNPQKDEDFKLEVLSALEPADWSALPPRWAGEVEATRPAEAPEPEALPELEELEPPTEVPPAQLPAPAPPSRPEMREALEAVATSLAVTPEEVASARRALAYYDRLLDMDASLRVAWQTRGELLRRLGRTEEAEASFRRADELELAERELGRAALTGLQTRAAGRPRIAGGRPAAGGRVNGRVNGLTNGRGRTNGRVNGLVNGTGAVNGLTNGLGRVNGLVSGIAPAEGRTNGLVNGNGFTNGRIGARVRPGPARGAEWARSVVGIAAVVLLMILAPILASILTAPPPALAISVDGSFGDWGRVSVEYADPVGDVSGNPDTDLVTHKLSPDPGGLAIYARFRGQAFRGAGGTADTLIALLDTDGRSDTGYDAGRIGADMAVEVYGWDGVAREAPAFQFRPGNDRSDWFGFQHVGGARAAASGSEVEFLVDVDLPSDIRVLLVAVDGIGRQDAADAVARAGAAAVAIRESTVAPEVITSSTDVAILQIDLAPAGLVSTVSSVNVTKLGSLPETEVSLTLARDDGDGVFTPADPTVAVASPSGGRASFATSLGLGAPTRLFVASDFATLPPNATFGLALESVAASGVATVAATNLSLSYLSSVPGPTVDGAFADWASVALSTDLLGDVANRTGAPPLVNANIDLREVGSVPGNDPVFYFRVDGAMLGGIDVVNLRTRALAGPFQSDSDLDTVPDNVEITLVNPDLRYDFNNDNFTDAEQDGDVDQDGEFDYPEGPDVWLNTTIPSWYPAPFAGVVVTRFIGPVAPRVLEGVDSAIGYVDADNSTATGLVATLGTSTYGFDNAVVVVGRHGRVATSELYRYRPGAAVPWEFAAPANAAVDATRLEVSAPGTALNLSAGYRTVYYATDWSLSYDVALPVPPGRSPAPGHGTRSPAGDNAVINEVSPQPNPEWVELANPTSTSISLSGWTIQRLKGNKWETLYTYTGQTLGAWGSGSEYLAVDLPPNSLPNGQTTLRLRDAAGTVADVTTYSPVGSGKSWSRFKDPTTGKPVDTDATGDFYVSLFPSKGVANDRHRPTITVAKTRNVATAAPGDQIVYTVYYNNTDTGRANHVWINDTLPSQVTYASSSVAPTGSSGQTYQWHFTNIAPSSSNSFTITVTVNDGTPSGALMANRADLEYTDQLDRKLTGSTAWANATCSRPVIVVSKTGTPSQALPGDTIVYTIYYNNTGSASAQHVWVNDTLPAEVTFVGSSAPPVGNSGQTYQWHFTNVAPGIHSFTITVTVNLNATSPQLVNWVFLNYTTQNGYKLEESSDSFTVAIPEFQDLALVAVVPLVLLGISRRLRRGAKQEYSG